MAYKALSNESMQFILILLVTFGGMIALFEKSGLLQGFSNALGKFANTRKKAMVATWLMGIILFIDDYLNVLATSFSMKELTDKNRVPREHLAYGVNSMGASIAVLAPISSWAAFAMGVGAKQGVTMNVYAHAVPLMFFPIIAAIVCLLVALGIIPKIGYLKKAYKRVDDGGPLLEKEENTGVSLVNMDSEDQNEIKATTPLNFIIPIIVLIVVMVIFDFDMLHGVFAAVVCQLILYLPQKIMKFGGFVETFFKGVTNMANLCFVVTIAYMLNVANDELGFSTFVIKALENVVNPAILPALIFITVSFITFAAGSFWILIVISIPIFVPLAINQGLNPALVVAAIMSAVAFGSKFCFFSDAVFMTSAGTGVANLKQIKTVAPYVLGSAVLAAICFLIAGIIMT